MIKKIVVLFIIGLSGLSLYSQSAGYFPTDSVYVKMSPDEYRAYTDYQNNPEALGIAEIIGLGTSFVNAIDKVMGCRCAQKLKDELLDIFLCEKFPESTFCDKINSDE